VSILTSWNAWNAGTFVAIPSCARIDPSQAKFLYVDHEFQMGTCGERPWHFLRHLRGFGGEECFYCGEQSLEWFLARTAGLTKTTLKFAKTNPRRAWKAPSPSSLLCSDSSLKNLMQIQSRGLYQQRNRLLYHQCALGAAGAQITCLNTMYTASSYISASKRCAR